jgi:HD-GYP domain-containing protein (c-di-GMP phosphodiesterase class II)
VYDALISERPYKRAWPEEEAVAEVERLAGSHLDPALVAAFVKLWRWGLIRRITREFQEEETASLLGEAA